MDQDSTVTLVEREFIAHGAIATPLMIIHQSR